MTPFPESANPPPVYLGDGVYIRWLADEGHYCLYVSHGLAEKNHIYLDPSVAGALVEALTTAAE